MNILEIITNTKRLSWSDRKFHLGRFKRATENFQLPQFKKIYLLGYAESKQIEAIVECLDKRQVNCLKNIFKSLPYAEDELGLTIIVPICAIYIAIDFNENAFFFVINIDAIDAINPTAQASFFSSAKGFPYNIFLGKKIVYEYNKN